MDDLEDAIKAQFLTLTAEGDKLYNTGQVDKALAFYSQALGLSPNDKHGLVARSKCHLRRGNVDQALRDAEKSLAHDKIFYKGLYQKAEALYQKSDFEMALVFYHRGHKLRPELDDFSLGIEKASEAIINSVGSSCSLNNNNTVRSIRKAASSDKSKPRTPTTTQQREKSKLKDRRKSMAVTKAKSITEVGLPSEKFQKTLLRELYVDKEYLESLSEDTDLMKSCISIKDKLFVRDLVSTGIDYLSYRTEFWRQSKPLYARKMVSATVPPSSDPINDALRKIVDMEIITNEDPTNYSKIVKIVDYEINRIGKCTEKQLQQSAVRSGDHLVTKTELICELALHAGRACMRNFQELESDDSFNKASEYFKMVYNMTKSSFSKMSLGSQPDIALERLGRLFVIKNNLESAIKVWLKREQFLANHKDELVILYHDIGRGYLTLRNHKSAMEFANLSQSMVSDQIWKMNVMVLQAEIHLDAKEIDKAKSVLESCLNIARDEKDTGAEKAVLDLLDRLSIRV